MSAKEIEHAHVRLLVIKEKVAAWETRKRQAERTLARLKKAARYYETKLAAFNGGKS